MLDVILTGKDIAEIFIGAQKRLQDKKIATLMDKIASTLEEDFKGDTKQFKDELIKISHQEWFQETINQAIIKASLANSTIAIRMMAIVVAVKVKDKNTALAFEDILLLRVLQDITDYEIIFLSKIYAKKRRGVLSRAEFGQHFNDSDPEIADQAIFKRMTNNLEKFNLISLNDNIDRVVTFDEFTDVFIKIYEKAC